MEDTLLVARQTGAALVEHLGLALLIGVVALRPALRAEVPWCGRALRRLERCAWLGFALLLAASLLRLWFAAAAMADVPLSGAGGAVVALLAATHYGRAWLCGLLVMAAMAIALARGAGRGNALLGAACAAYAYALGAASHAAERGDFSVAMLIAWLHVLAISVWSGVVFVAGYAVLPPASFAEVQDRRALAGFAATLSREATWALLALIGSGAYNVWARYETLHGLSAAASGRVLAVKLMLVALAAGCGAANRYGVLPRIVEAPAPGEADRLAPSVRRFQCVLRVEAVVLAATLAAATLLGALPTP